MPAASGSEDQFRMPPDRPRRARLIALAVVALCLTAAGAFVYARRQTRVVEVAALAAAAPPPAPAGSTITVVSDPEDAKVMLDGVVIDTRVALPVDPGQHTLSAEREGFERVDRSLTLKPGEPVEVRLNLVRVGANPVAAAAGAPEGDRPQARPRRRSKKKAERPRPPIPGVIYLDWKK